MAGHVVQDAVRLRVGGRLGRAEAHPRRNQLAQQLRLLPGALGLYHIRCADRSHLGTVALRARRLVRIKLNKIS